MQAAAATSSPEQPESTTPPKFTRQQLGQLRRQYWTVVKGTVKACGHKVAYDASKQQPTQPKNNCIYCWEAYFLTAVDLEGVHAVITQGGVPELVKVRGKKFTKMFHGFLSSKLLPALAAEINPTPSGEDATQITGGTFDNSTGNTVQADSDAQQIAG